MIYNGHRFPPFIEISPIDQLKGTVHVPASKSTSTRSLLTASLATGSSHILNCAESNNANAMKASCQALGAIIDKTQHGYDVTGIDITEITNEIMINPGNSGVVLRLLMGVAARLNVTHFVTDFSHSLGKRSQSEMISALQMLGVSCESRTRDGQLPITLRGTKAPGKYTEISCRKSSQFLSGLLYFGAISENDLHIKVTDSITAPSMVRTTINNLRSAGVDIEHDDKFLNFYTCGAAKIHNSTFIVGSDPASSAALLGMCATVNSDVLLNGFYEEELGNGAVIDYLCRAGAMINTSATNVLHISGGDVMKGLDFDGSLAPDAVPALAAVAAFAEGKSTFFNIEHLRYKECNRISDFRRELSKLGVKSEETLDTLTIYGNPKGYDGGVIVEGHFDHAIIMALTTLGARCKNSILIKNPYHVGQTYPSYFNDINALGGNCGELAYSGA